MRALAEFIMRGRLQAGTVAIFGYVIPLLAPIAVALVTLRKGAFEGTIVLLLGLFPALLSLIFGDAGSVVIWMTLLSLLLVYVPALVLRSTISLSMMILSAIVTACVVTLIILSLAPNAVDMFIESMNTLMLSEASQQEDVSQVPLSIIASQAGVSGMIAYILAFNGLTGVLLGRWLQSVAFNPKGFGAEFIELRLGMPASVVCFMGSIFLRYQGDEYWWWSNVLAIPLVLVAIAIAHHVAQVKQLAKPWLVLFYFAVFTFMPVMACIGFVDAWINFRNRLHNK